MENRRSLPLSMPADISNRIIDKLESPIPSMEQARLIKEGYAELPIDNKHPLYNEPVTNLLKYGIAGQSYYSRPNSNSNDALDWVDPNVYVRQSVAESLAVINQFLALPMITEYFSGEVELFIQDGLRPISLQKMLYEEFYPNKIRNQFPNISDDDFRQKLKGLASVPSDNPARPSSHATGAVFDLTIRYFKEDPRFDGTKAIGFGHISGDVSYATYPDYYEQNKPTSKSQTLGRRNRRALYAIMTGAAFGRPTGFVNNPTEWWHWGRGDQLSAKLSGADTAYYSIAKAPTEWK